MLAGYPLLFGHRIGKLAYQLQAIAQAHLAQHDAICWEKRSCAAHADTSAPRAAAISPASRPSSAKTCSVSCPVAGTSPPPVSILPSTSKGKDGARKVEPSAHRDRDPPPGRITCGSSYISQGLAMGE